MHMPMLVSGSSCDYADAATLRLAASLETDCSCYPPLGQDMAPPPTTVAQNAINSESKAVQSSQHAGAFLAFLVITV